MTNELYTTGIWTVKPGNERAFAEAWRAFAEWTAQNVQGVAGDVRLLQDLERPQLFISVGPWRDADSIAAWRQRPEFKAFIATARGLCEGIPSPHNMRVVAHLNGQR